SATPRASLQPCSSPACTSQDRASLGGRSCQSKCSSQPRQPSPTYRWRDYVRGDGMSSSSSTLQITSSRLWVRGPIRGTVGGVVAGVGTGRSASDEGE